MTPMQKLKNQFDDFKKLLPANFKELSLNFSEAKTHTTSFCGEGEVHYDKGVKSDFIKLFQLKHSDKDAWSIGFAFDYLDNKNLVQVSMKEGVSNPLYFNGEIMAMEDFKVLFIKTIGYLQNVVTNNSTS